MDFNDNAIIDKIMFLSQEHLLPKKAEFSIKTSTNQDNVRILELDIDSPDTIGLVIIYEDGHVFFNYINKNDETMNNVNWSNKIESVNALFSDITDFFVSKIK